MSLVFHIRIWYLILETIAPELEEMDEETHKDLMRDIRAIYLKDDSVMKSFTFGLVVVYLNRSVEADRDKDNKTR